MKPVIVLSGVNFVEGGPLAIFQDALQALAEHFLDRYDVTAFVHRADLFDVPGISFIELPEIKTSWLKRLYFEYVQCHRWSLEIQPFLWLAMHDMTPNVEARIQSVYCHNPAPFYQLSIREALIDRTFALFRLLYRFLYRFNISKNDFVIVQQEWLRNEFLARFPVRTVVVAHPSIPRRTNEWIPTVDASTSGSYVFFYPALPRSFKNVELILEAAALLEARAIVDFEIRLTLAGTESRYSMDLRKRFHALKTVRWLGIQTRARVQSLYQESDCLLFPSKLETWGMPISEWKRTGKPMLVADLPYAHETVGDYDAVNFIDIRNAEALADKMFEQITHTGSFSGSKRKEIDAPFAENWRELFEILLRERKAQSPIEDVVQPLRNVAGAA